MIIAGVRHKVFAAKGTFELYNTFMNLFDTTPLVHHVLHADVLAPLRLCLKYGMAIFDAPNTLAHMRQTACAMECASTQPVLSGGAVGFGPDSQPLSRFFGLAYTILQLLPFWIAATPIVSFIWGSYLCGCITFLHIHTNEAFSSLRIEDYKNFLR
jgi:hypothetical protein